MINVNIHNTYITNIQLWFVFFPERALGLALCQFQNVPINTQVFPQKLSCEMVFLRNLLEIIQDLELTLRPINGIQVHPRLSTVIRSHLQLSWLT